MHFFSGKHPFWPVFAYIFVAAENQHSGKIRRNLSPKKYWHSMKRGCAANLNYDTAFFVNLPSHASEDALQGFNLIVPKVLRLLHIVGLGEVGHREHRPVGQLRLRDSQLEV